MLEPCTIRCTTTLATITYLNINKYSIINVHYSTTSGRGILIPIMIDHSYSLHQAWCLNINATNLLHICATSDRAYYSLWRLCEPVKNNHRRGRLNALRVGRINYAKRKFTSARCYFGNVKTHLWNIPSILQGTQKVCGRYDRTVTIRMKRS